MGKGGSEACQRQAMLLAAAAYDDREAHKESLVQNPVRCLYNLWIQWA
jgi:hypothetical protein